MKKFIPVLTYGILALAFYAVLGNTPYAQYGENYISFVGIIMLVGAIAFLLVKNSIVTKAIADPNYKQPSHLRRSILTLLRIIAAVISAALGWYFVASGFLLYSLFMLMEYDEIKKGKEAKANG